MKARKMKLAAMAAMTMTLSLSLSTGGVALAGVLGAENVMTVSGGDVSGGDVSGGDVSGGDESTSVTGVVTQGPGEIRPNYVYQYKAEVTPANATNKKVTWTVGDNKIAEIISVNGSTCQVRGIREGSTKLTATAEDGGFVSTIELKVSAQAGISDTIIASDYEVIKDALTKPEVKNYEYYVNNAGNVSATTQKDIFTSISETDKTFKFTFTSDNQEIAYSWEFVGAQMSNPSISIDFATILHAGNAEVLAAVKDNVKKTDIHFAHNGALPGKAIVSVKIGDFFAKNNLYLYYYNPTTKSLSLVSDKVSVENGYALLPIDHCSDYILTADMLRSLIPVIDEKADAEDGQGNASEDTKENTAQTTQKAPKTGDKGIFVGTLACISAAVAAVYGKRSKKLQK